MLTCYYKKSVAIILALCLAGIALFGFLAYKVGFSFGLLLLLAGLLAYLTVCVLVVFMKDLNSFTSMQERLNFNCDVYAYIEKFDKQKSKTLKRKKYLIKTMEAECFCLLGDYKNALDCIKKIDCEKLESKKGYRGDYCLYLEIMLKINFYLSDEQQTNLYLDKLKDLSKSKELIKIHERNLLRYIIQFENIRRLESGDYDEALGYFGYKTRMSKTTYERVVNSFFYGKALVFAGKKEKAKEQLSYAAENGKSVYVVTLANELLATLV